MLQSCKIGAVCLFAASLSSYSASGQLALSHRPSNNAASQQKRQVFPDTAAASAAAAAPVTGTFVAKFTIKLVTPVPSGSQVLCELNANLFEENTTTGTVSNEIEEDAAAKATVSGSTASCTVSIPYSWTLATPSSDTVNLGYYLYIVNPTGANESALTRSSTQFLPGAGSIKVPASGTTTTYTVNSTL